MEALVALSEGSPGVRSVGVGEYINEFFDVIDDDVPWHWRELSCLTPVEVEALNQVSKSFDSGMLAEQTPMVGIAAGADGRRR